MKKTYTLTCFKETNKSGFSVDYNTLRTAFYHLRDCYKSGIYPLVIFRVNTNYRDENIPVNTSQPVLMFKNNNIALCDGLTKTGVKRYKHYLTRFNTYLNRGKNE